MTDILGLLLAGAAMLAGLLILVIKELRKRWVKRLANYLDHRLRRSVSRFGAQYREFVLRDLRFIDVKGLATKGPYTPELDEVFVDVSLVHQAPHKVAEGLLGQLPTNVTDRRTIWEFLDRSLPMVMAVVGVPGSGKTTLLRHTAGEMYRSRRGRRRTVPILLFLRDHVAAIAANTSVAVPELVRASLGRYREYEPPGWFEQRLRDGDCVVLLDGLDEVATEKGRRSVAAWVERQTKQYPKNDFVITSRPQGYRTASIDGAIVLQVRNFTHDQVVRLVRGWYFAVEKHSTNAAGEDVKARAESAADNLLERLNGAPGLYDLTVNPLLLTMIANVHRYRGALPGSRASLYSEICQVMLWRRHEAKKLDVGLSGDKKEALLRGLAFTMMQERVRDLPRNDVLAKIKPILRRMSRELTPEDFLADINSNGMLIERESGSYSFAHLTFQEYLAAAHIRDKGMVGVLAGFVDDIWWREATLLYTANADADPIVKACLESGSPTALSLAFECTEQGAELDPELHDRLDDLFRSIQDDPEQHRQMTRVLLARTLRPSIHVVTGSRICAAPITMGIYRWYVRSTGSHAPDRPEARAEDPVIGVRGGDALAFIRWVNFVTSGDPGYRLPTAEEISDPAVRRAIPTPTPSIWVADENHFVGFHLWTSTHVPHPHVIDGATLAMHVREDVSQSKPALVRLLLLRAISAARTLANYHHSTQHDDGPVLNLISVLDKLLEPAIDFDLDEALDRSFYRALAPGDTQDAALGLAMEISDTLAALEIEMADVIANFALQKYESRLDQSIAHCLEFARALDGIRDSSLDQRNDTILDRVLGGVRARDFVDQRFATLIGTALSSTIRRALDERPTSVEWARTFSRIYVDETRVDGKSWTISLDMLEDSVHRIQADFLESSLMVSAGPNDWKYRTLGRLVETASPIFGRKQPLTQESAGSVRLMALCLAAEADVDPTVTLGDRLRAIAAGMTLLERRAKGQAPITETIILATD